MTLLQYALLGALAILLGTAAWGDIATRLIPNRLNAGIALLAVPWWWASGAGAGNVLLQIGCAAAMLAVFGGCFALGMMGGGDVKLIVALALWLPPAALARLLVVMALAGGGLTAAMLAWAALRRTGRQPEIPYGVAIAAAALATMANRILTTAAA